MHGCIVLMNNLGRPLICDVLFLFPFGSSVYQLGCFKLQYQPIGQVNMQNTLNKTSRKRGHPRVYIKSTMPVVDNQMRQKKFQNLANNIISVGSLSVSPRLTRSRLGLLRSRCSSGFGFSPWRYSTPRAHCKAQLTACPLW